MSSVVVFVFLLDNLAGFNNALNETLIKSAKYTQSVTPIMQNCDPVATDQILSAVSHDLDLDMVPTFRSDDNHIIDDKEQSPENLYNPVLENSLDPERAEEFINKPSGLFDDYDTFYYRRFYDTGNYETDTHDGTKKKQQAAIETKVDFPRSALFLVAIFETLSNITAQTCAGTLLSPRWVLTAANCVNILSHMYANSSSTNTTESSHTIVVGSTNPLLDGTVHNVTSVLFNPDFNSSHAHKAGDLDGPYLALMRIVPEVDAPTIPLMEEYLNKGDVMVYGWSLSKNESDHETLNRTSMSALILSSAECRTTYQYKDNDVICLFNNDKDKNIKQLSSGGPVLVVHNNQVKMLAVVQTDEHLFVAYPLEKHVRWINQIINSK